MVLDNMYTDGENHPAVYAAENDGHGDGVSALPARWDEW